VAIASELRLPYFLVFDCDGDEPADTPERPTGRRQQHERDNKALFKLTGVQNQDPFPASPVWKERLAAWPTNIGNIFEEEIGKDKVDTIKRDVRNKYGIGDMAGMKKNPLFVGYVVAEAWDAGLRSPTLIKSCDAILEYGRSLGTAVLGTPTVGSVANFALAVAAV